MAEPTDIILEFLRKHHFVKAEAAFMAELKDRPVFSCENALNWDLQLRTLASLNDANDSVDSRHEYRHAKASEKRLSAETLPSGISSPPEKQLYVEYEPRKAESLQDPPEIASKSGEYDDTMPFPGDHVLSPTYKQDNRGEILIQQVSRSLAIGQSASSSERSITDRNQTSKVNGKRFEQYPIQHNNEGLHFQELSKDSTSFQHLPGLQSPSHQHQLPWNGTKCNGFGTEVVTSPELFTCSNSAKGETVMSKNENISLSSTKNKGKPNLPSAEGWPECPLERKDRQRAEGFEVTNNFITSSTSTGSAALKTCMPPLFLKLSQQEECMRMLMPDSADLRNQEFGIGMEKVRSGIIIDHSHSSEMESMPNYIQAEGLPRLPPVKLHSMERNLNTDGQYEDLQKRLHCDPLENNFGFVTSADDQLDQESLASGMKRSVVRPSVSEGIMVSMTDELSGFAIPGERWYGDEYCNSDTYDDEDDPGYCRQPIEDEEWFLTYEIDYPSDNERARQVVDKSTLPVSKQSKKIDEDGHSFIEEESYFSGEEYYKLQAAKEELYISRQSELDQAQVTSKLFNNDIPSRDNDHSKIDETEELSFVGSLPSWKGFMGQPNEVRHEDVIIGGYRSKHADVDGFEDGNRGSARSGGILGSSDAVDIGSELKEESLSGGNSEGDLESLREQVLDLYGSTLGKFDPEDFLASERGTRAQENITPLKNLQEGRDEDEQNMILQYYDEAWGYSKRSSTFKTTNVELGDTFKHLFKNKNLASHSDKITPNNNVFEGFSFPSPSSTGELAASAAGSGKSLWSNRDSPVPEEEIDVHGNDGMVGPDNTLAAWKRKNDRSSPVISSTEGVQDPNVTHQWSESIHSTDEYASLEAREDGNEELDVGIELPTEFKPSAQEEDDTIGAQEEFRSMVIDEDQFEIFDLRIIHRKNRTGFEEAKEFPVMLNSIIAGRYHVTEYLGSAAFSKAIQAHDLHTGIDVCMKIIKNNKDFFDQSLDEIKLLKFINKHDPADKYHVLRLYDYFYHREHLFIVCELLRANLYEFHKFNRESGGEVYFTMPRIQSITRQCLEALEFLHGLGIIHCDLKPENILVKSYSRCEIKVIDLGSSCFQTDHLCSYVQSRSYRAPEVILGLPYDQKIDIWSMGCILAELSSGNVLFQNDSLTTLLARVVGILGPIDPHVLAKGRDTYKYFTRNHMLYERNQETGRLEYLLPKKTSLRHRIPMGDEGFVEFVRYLLQSDPAKRPTATEALRHPWLSFQYEPMSS